MSRPVAWMLVLLLVLGAAGPAAGAPDAEDPNPEETEPELADDVQTPTRRTANFGGPDAVGNQLRDDARGEPIFQRYSDWKAGLAEKHGFAFSLDYSAVYLGASDGPGEKEAAGGMVRFYGSWDLVGRESGNTGALVWKVEHRHAYTDVAPGGFGFELGYVGLMEPPFSDQGGRLTNLYWRQRLAGGTATLVGGYVDVTDYLDVYALASPWTGFMNFAFSTGSATIPTPNEGFGLAGATMLGEHVFLIAGLADTNSDPTRPGDTVDSFFSDHEYFKHIEIGLTPSKDAIYLDNLHLTYWHVDERVEAQVPDGWGVNLSYTRYINERWLPFLRAGYAKDGGSLLERAVSAGFGYQWEPGKDLIGFGLHWGRPNETSFGPDLPDQFVAELFYRWTPTQGFALTPDIQYLSDPALNLEQTSIWVFGLRARLVI